MILLTVGWLGIAVMFLVNTVRRVSVGLGKECGALLCQNVRYQATGSFWERNLVHFCAKTCWVPGCGFLLEKEFGAFLCQNRLII